MRQALLRRGRPFWLRRKPNGSRPTYPALKSHREVDVAIVGGGITGALTALAFAEADVKVVVLEAARVAHGSTAASSALLLQEPDQGMGELARRYGGRASRRIWELSHDAVRDFIRIIRKHRIACDLVDRDSLFYAPNADAEQRLRAEYRLRTRAGFDEEWLTPGAVRRETGMTARGAIRSRGNAHFDPHRACAGLMQAAARAGAEVFERSPVVRIERQNGRMRIRTRSGTVDAARVIVATGYATAQFRPLAGRFRMLRTYVLMTRRLNASARNELGLNDVMVWDTERPYHYARWTTDHRLLLGGGDRPVRTGRRRDQEFAAATKELREDFEALLPALADVGFDGAWEGLFAMTPDSLPYIGPHRLYPGHLFALGYGGNGMTFGALAARMLLEQWQGVRSPDHRLFRFGRLR